VAWPSWSAFEGVEIGQCRGDQTHGDGVKIGVRRQSEVFDQLAFRSVRRCGLDPPIASRVARNDGSKRLLFRLLFPFAKYLDGEMLIVGVNLLAMYFTEPDTVRLVTPLLTRETRIITWPSWRGSRYVRRDTDNYESVVAAPRAYSRVKTLWI
jgi:hypothetical protein